MTHRNKKMIAEILMIILVLSGFFLVVATRFPLRTALLLGVGMPFFLIIPGACIVAAMQRQFDSSERWTLALAYSLMMNASALYAVERLAKKLTPTNTALTIGVVTCGALGVLLWKRHYDKRPRSQ